MERNFIEHLFTEIERKLDGLDSLESEKELSSCVDDLNTSIRALKEQVAALLEYKVPEPEIEDVFTPSNNELAKMVYRTNVDATASVYSAPILQKALLRGVEDVLETYINPQILNQNRKRVSENYSMAQTGKEMVQHIRKVAMSDHKETNINQNKLVVGKVGKGMS